MRRRQIAHTALLVNAARRSGEAPPPDAGVPAPLKDDDLMLSVTITPTPDRVFVQLDGALDDTTAVDLRRALSDLPDHPARTLVFDMSRVPLVDSDGFGVLINIQKRLADSGRVLILVGCQEAVRIALALTRLEVLFPHYPTLQDIPKHRR